MTQAGRMQLRRRREQKTDYRVRKRLLLSGLPRLVVREFAKNTWIQVVEAQLGGDKVIASASTKRLAREFGWKGAGGNTPAAYLTGLLAAVEAGRNGVKEAVFDAGSFGLVKGSRAAAALKGAVDGGLSIAHSEDVLPTGDRIRGEHISKYAGSLRSVSPELYRQRFSTYLSRGIEPTRLTEHFEEVRGRIVGSPTSQSVET